MDLQVHPIISGTQTHVVNSSYIPDMVYVHCSMAGGSRESKVYIKQAAASRSGRGIITLSVCVFVSCVWVSENSG